MWLIMGSYPPKADTGSKENLEMKLKYRISRGGADGSSLGS